MNSSLIISQADGRPMYLQVMERVKERIAVGDWKPGQAIPSIRQMAVDAQVSVITVKRAYLELEREGVIATQHGKGSTVASDAGLGSRLHEQALRRHLEEAARLAVLLGVSTRDMRTRLAEAMDRFALDRKAHV